MPSCFFLSIHLPWKRGYEYLMIHLLHNFNAFFVAPCHIDHRFGGSHKSIENGNVATAIDGHRGILRAIEKKDLEEVNRAISYHLEQSKKDGLR